jgi:hypothetical protein
MNKPRARYGILLLGILAISGIAAVASQPAPLGLIIDPEPSEMSVSVWTNKPSYVIGENVTIFFNVSRPAYVYIYDIQPDGVVRLIFPNAYSQNNFVSAGTHSLPDGLYKFTVAPPTGTEQLQIIASPLSLGLEQPFGEPFPMVGSNPSAATDDIQAHIMGIIPEPNYVTAWASFIISGYYSPPTPTPPYTPPYTPPSYYPPNPFYPYPPFYGFPGGNWYWDGSEWHYGVPPSGWYWYWGPDGKWHFRIRICFGC